MTVTPVIKKMIHQTEVIKQRYPTHSETHQRLEKLEDILSKVCLEIIHESNSYNDNI